MTTILVVGGYGAVGRALCQSLQESPNLSIVVAGRNLAKAEHFAARTGAAARQIDLCNPASWPCATEGIDMAIVCMDQNDTRFVRYLMERHIHYVDLSANDLLFRQIEELSWPSEAVALLSVGLAPGLTNMLAKACANHVELADKVTIGLMGGTGDMHGSAGIEWLADQLFDPDRESGTALIDFGQALGVHRAHQIAFADQFVLVRRAAVAEALTVICLNSRAITSGLFFLAQVFQGSKHVRRLMVWLLESLHFGSNLCTVSVNLTGRTCGTTVTNTVIFHGSDEPVTTGRIAAIMVRLLLKNLPAPGVWHSHEVFDPDRVMEEVEMLGIGFFEWDLGRPAPACQCG